MEWLSKILWYGVYFYPHGEPPPSSCRFPTEIILRIFLSIEDGECPGCSICRMDVLYRCCLVSRAANESTTKLLYHSLDLSFCTAVRLDRIPANGHRSLALRRGILRNPELMVERGKPHGNGKPYMTDCPRHYKLWRERNCSYSFGKYERTLALLRRTLGERNSGIPRAVRWVKLPERYQYPWELGNDSDTVHPMACRIVPWLADILGLLQCLESVKNLANLMTFLNLVPGPELLQRSILKAVATNDCWRDWDWGEHQNPRQLHYLSHFGINSAREFIAIHSGWGNLRHLSLGTVLVEGCIGDGFPFVHLPNLRSLEVAGGRSFATIFNAIPPNQLSSLSIQPGPYGDYASGPLISYLQRRDENAPRAAQRLTNLTLLAAVDDTTSSLYDFRLDHFISAILASAPQLQLLHLALVSRRQPPLDRLYHQSPLGKLYAPGARLCDIKLAISAHDWSWLVPSLEASMFPALRAFAITPAQHIDELGEVGDWEQALAHFSCPPGQIGGAAAKAQRCREMDEDLAGFFAAKEGQGHVELRFIGSAEEEEMLAGGARG